MFFIYLHEQGYKTIRKLTAKALTSNRQGYEPVVSVGQALLSWFKIPSLYRNYSQYLSDLNINTRLFSLNYASPITFAAFEGHLDSLQYWLNLGCGGGCLKTIKVLPETGNPKPRLQQLTINQDEHLLNALGLPGPGVDGLIKQLSHHALIKTKAPIDLVLRHCMSDYQAVFDRVHQNEASLFDQLYYEINISCPNTSTGRSLHDQMADIESLLIYMRKKLQRSLSSKYHLMLRMIIYVILRVLHKDLLR